MRQLNSKVKRLTFRFCQMLCDPSNHNSQLTVIVYVRACGIATSIGLCRATIERDGMTEIIPEFPTTL